MQPGRKSRAAAIILLISLLFTMTNSIVTVQAKAYAFTAAISPTEVNVNQLLTYSVIITNTGESSLGSASISIPTGFTVSEPVVIINPTSSWTYTLSSTAISLTGLSGGSAVDPGQNVKFNFDAIAPAFPGVMNWTATASSSIGGGGVTLVLEGAQPAVVVISSFFAPTISTSIGTINQGQASYLSQLTGASGGKLPYNYQWLQTLNGGEFSPISGANGPDFTFSPTTSTATGTWSFKLNVTDSSVIPLAITSNTVDVVVNPALVAPEVTANPTSIAESQPSLLSSSPITTGTSPYTHQWFQKAPGSDYIAVGSNSSSYTFLGSTNLGTWKFLLQVTDNTGDSVNSSEVDVIISSTPVYTIAVTQSVHGTITPGTTSISGGGSQEFTFLSDVGCQVVDVLVDGSSVGAVTSYEFTTVAANHTLAAIFTQIDYALTVSVVGSGSVASSPSQAIYHYGDSVQLTAAWGDGWSFSGWSGDFSSSLNPISIIINGSTSVTATFAQTASYVLTISIVGSGSVGKTPDQASYNLGDVVTLTANPSLGWSFSGWSGALAGLVSPADLTITGNTAVTAAFVQNTCSLTVSVIGSGSISLNNNGPYHLGDVVRLTANPSSGWSFSAWSGALSGSANPADLAVAGDLSVTATFTQNAYSLTISTIGSGSVVISPSQASYHYGDVVQLTAIPTSDWRFGGWTGDLVGPLNPSSITISGNSAVTAVFVVGQYTIAASAGEGGSITPPGITIVDAGGSQAYNITASIGYTIVDVLVNGTSVGHVSSYTVSNVTGDTLITASFAMHALAINSWAGLHGSISPNGPVAATYGNDQSFLILPDVGYRVADALVDGISVGAVASYTFVGVTGNHTIYAAFEISSCSIEASAGPNGTIDPAGTTVADWNSTQSYTITPGENYHIKDVVVDGISLGPISSYVFTQITSSHNITASFELNANFFINVTSSHGSPSPSTEVIAGNSLTISVMEIEGDQSHRWICTGYSVDGGTLASGTNYTFVNIQASHTIAFNWQEQYRLTVVSPVGSTTGTGWYNIGTAAIASVSSDTIASGTGTRQVFTGWTGDVTSTDVTSKPMTMDGAKTATANWKAQYQVTYATSGSTLHVIVPPTEWIDSAAPPTGAFPASTTNSVGNTRVVFVRDNRPSTVTGPITITGIYQTQYLVTFNQSGVTYRGLGTIVTIVNETKLYEQLASTVWVNSGNSVAFSYAETVESADIGNHFALAGTNATSPLAINEPITIHADYELQTSFTLNTILMSALVLSVPPLVAIPVFVLRRGKRRITPIAIGGGLISPGTTQKIERGGDSTVFIIAANSGYRIADVVVDNTTHLGAIRTYKFFNVDENHTISAIFYKDPHQNRVVPATQTPAKHNL